MSDYDGVQGVGLVVAIKISPVEQNEVITAMEMETLQGVISTAVTDALAGVISGEWIASVSVRRSFG